MWNHSEKVLLKYLVLFYPTLIVIEKFVPLIDTLLTAGIIFILAIALAKREKAYLYFKYYAVLFLYAVSRSFLAVYTDQDHMFKSLLIFLMAMDCYRGQFYSSTEQFVFKFRRILEFQIVGILIANIGLIFVGTGYSTSYSQEWGLHAYQGIFGDPHQAAYRMCALLIFILLINQKDYKPSNYLLVFGYEVCIVMTGARVPTTLGIALGVLFCIDHRLKFIAPSKIISDVLSFIFSISLFIPLGYVVLFRTAFGNKINNSMNSGAFDSGRSILRQADWRMFDSSNWFHRLFGNGMDAVVYWHAKIMGTSIWSHNDFMQILAGMGIFTLFIYIAGWMHFGIGIIKTRQLSAIIIWTIFVAVAFYNGLFIYSRFAFVLPLFYRYVLEISSNHIAEKKFYIRKVSYEKENTAGIV